MKAPGAGTWIPDRISNNRVLAVAMVSIGPIARRQYAVIICRIPRLAGSYHDRSVGFDNAGRPMACQGANPIGWLTECYRMVGEASRPPAQIRGDRTYTRPSFTASPRRFCPKA